MKKLLIIVSLASFMFAGEMGLSAYGGLGLANVSYGEDLETGVTAGMKPGLNIGFPHGLSCPIPLKIRPCFWE